MYVLLDILAMALAIGQICDTWFNGDIFSGQRAKLEAYQEVRAETRRERLMVWLADMLLCPFCLAHHVMFLLVVVFWLPTFVTSWGAVTMLPVYGLAALRLSILVNGALPDRLKY